MDDCPTVSCERGRVKGYVNTIDEEGAKPVYCYRNIPYGKPPVGSLRFMAPAKADAWEGELDGTTANNSPIQTTMYDKELSSYYPHKNDNEKAEANEDCLNLTVYTPDVTQGKNLPVMFWIFGDSFQSGTELMYDGSVLAGMNGVIVVIPNFRVGLLGFFSLGKSSICPGNAGILDIVLALEWVRDNIGAFGGDAGNVTIMGNSSGGATVNFLINSPLPRGLFHKAISCSGTANMPEIVQPDNSDQNKVFFQAAKIGGLTNQRILEKAQNIPAENLEGICNKLAEEYAEYMPILDEKLITQSPEESLNAKDFVKLPYIIGVNNTEGHGLLATLAAPGFIQGIQEGAIIEPLMYFLPRIDSGKCLHEWKKFYVKDEEDPVRFSKMFGDIIGDATYVVPAVTTACAHAEAGSNVYFYEGAFQLRMYHDDEFGPTLAKKADWCKCDHGDEAFLIFGMPFTPEDVAEGCKFTEEEKELSRKIMTYFTNFAKTGDPNKGAEVEMQWPEYKPCGKHIVFDNEIKIGENLARKEVELWTKTIPEMHKCTLL